MGREATERQIQSAYFQYLKAKGVRDYALMIPNEGARGKFELYSLINRGMAPGFPDLALLIPRNGFHGLFIELKSAKGKVSNAQKVWIERLRNQGYKAEVCFGLDLAMKVTDEYLTV